MTNMPVVEDSGLLLLRFVQVGAGVCASRYISTVNSAVPDIFAG
jgi:cell shape-determining protein MreC